MILDDCILFLTKTSGISISVCTLRSSCLKKISRNHACAQEELLCTTFTHRHPSPIRTVSSLSRQVCIYNKVRYPKYEEYKYY